MPDTSELPDPLEAKLRAALAPNLLLVREIGAGGMARVFLAREPSLKRNVAVKVLASDQAITDAARARFEREAQAVAGLSHPNVVAVHTVGDLDDGTPYFIMQFVEGRSMSDRIQRDGPISVAEARRALGEVAAALAAAHAQGIIHRDVKPANILYEESTGRSLVSDFGIAAIGREAEHAPVNMKLTATGSILGTPQYMSPEQLLSEPVTEKTDVYSLGLLAHELLCGTSPFKASSPHELIAAHLRDVPARLSVRRPDVDAELDAVIASCLEKSAASRPAAAEVARRLTPGAGALLEWPPPGLDGLVGAMRRVSAMAVLGGFMITGIMLAILWAGPLLNSALTSLATLLALIGAIGGSVPLGIAFYRASLAGVAAATAIKSGYAWMTVLETMADVRGDTGNLITASREYAGLRPAERDHLRRRRVRREVALLLGGLLALPMLVITLMLGSMDVVDWRAAWLGVAVPVTALILAVIADEIERNKFAPRQRRPAPDATGVSRLAPPWNESFETVRAGQVVGRGAATQPNAGRWIVAGVGAFLGVLLILVAPFAIVGTIGPAYWSVVIPQFVNVRERVRLAELARPYESPKDSSVSALAAGRAYVVLGKPLAAGRFRSHAQFPELPLPVVLPTAQWEGGAMASDLFRTARWNTVPGLPSTLKVFAAVRAGLGPNERAFLERVAAAPHWEHFDIIGRARSMDYFGARFQLPFAPGASTVLMPLPRFQATKLVAYANVSRAAYHLSRGRRDSAEAVLRRGVAFGFRILDDGNFALDQVVGSVLVGIARQGLIDLFKATGDPRGPALEARVDSVVAQIEAAVNPNSRTLFPGIDARDSRAVRAAISRDAEDPRAIRGERMEMMSLLSLTPCTNVRELVFGLSPDVKAIFDRQRKELGRFPSDSAFFDMLERQSEAMPNQVGDHWASLLRVSRIVGGILRNKRLPGCVGVLSQFIG